MSEQTNPEQSNSPNVWPEIGSVEVVESAGLVRVTTTGDGMEATAYLHPDDADRLATLVRGAAITARGRRS